jgi:cytochrome c peroxidase
MRRNFLIFLSAMVLASSGGHVFAAGEPTVRFMQPSAGNSGPDLGVVADAFDADGKVKNVTLYINDQKVRREGAAPYEWGTANSNKTDSALLNLKPGIYKLRAVAKDNQKKTASTTLTVTVLGDNGSADVKPTPSLDSSVASAGTTATNVAQTSAVSNGSVDLQVGDEIGVNQYLQSANGEYRFNLQGDGNLVLRDQATGSALWSSKTNGQNGSKLVMQGDGNLVLYTAASTAVWSSVTNGSGATRFVVQGDGNAVIYTASGLAVWDTGTANSVGDTGSGGVGSGGNTGGAGSGSDGGGTGGETANSTGTFSAPSAALYSLNSSKVLGFPKHIDTGFGGNGHAESWDGRIFVRTQSKGWFASAFRPERIVRNGDNTVSFNQGAFGNSISLELKTEAPEMQHNWLAIVPDFAVSGENPYPSNSNGNYQVTGAHRTYKALVYHTTSDKQMGIRKATFIISNANTRDAQLIKADFTNSFDRLRLQNGADFKCIEPSVTIDGRLVICQGHPNNDGKIDNLVYSYTITPGSTTNWTAPKSIANMYFDDRNTNIEGLPFAERYPIAQQPILDATGNDFNRGELIKGAYPWVSRDGSELFYQASNQGVSARRTGTSVIGRWTGWTIRHIDGPINRDRHKTSKLFLSSPGAFTTMWTPYKDIADLAIPYSLQGPVYPIFGSNTSDYMEIGFDDYLDGNYVMYLGMNEQLNRAGNYQVTRTNDTSGNFNNANLVGARFPIEFNGQDQLVGRYGQAIHFNSGNYLSVTKNSGWNSLSEGASVDMWVKKSSASGRVRLFNMQDGVELNLINGSTLSAVIHDTNSNSVQINGTSISNNWTHVGFTFNPDNKEMTLYVNGISVATKSAGNFGTLRTTGAVRVGPENSSGQLILDEVKVSNVARRAYEIAHNANARTNKAPSAALANQVPDHLKSLLDNANDVDLFSLQAAALGEDLFSDELLSKEQTTSCATCHNDALAFSDGLDIARGNEPTDAGTRNTPMLQNRLFSSLQGWSGMAGSLDKQALIPIAAAHEMNLPIAEAVQRLRANSTYANRFQQVYGEAVNETNLPAALASFEAIQFSPKNRVDEYKEGNTSVLSAAERRGLDLFDGKARCSGCHSGANFTDESFRNNGLAMNDDIGRAEVTGRDRDHKLFKVPSLRELGLTGPYMHDGSLSTLKAVVEKYNDGARNVASTDSDIRPLELNSQEVNDVVAYLAALSVNGDSGGTDGSTSVSEVSRVNGDLVGGAGSSKPGFTLYVFDNDQGSNGSTCNGGCATAWPPVLVEDSAASGVSGLTTITRTDGSKQAAYNGRPVYFYAQDNNAGDTKGKGVNASWWLASSDNNSGGETGGAGEGTITRQVWTGISGTGLASLTGLPSYPNSPSTTNELTSFEAQSNWANDYGTRIIGYLHAPITGMYTFWIATDDNGELWLSSNDSASNKQKIASISNWAGIRNWTKFPSQKSVNIPLQAGQRYYIEALQKEGGGGDNIAVAWQQPGGSLEVIPGKYLSPIDDVNESSDTTAPVITLRGNQAMNVDQGAVFTDPGFTATDDQDGNITSSVTVTGNTNTSQLRTFILSYNVRDAAGNRATPVTRTVTVKQVADTTPPVISLWGSNPMTLVQGTRYNEPGAAASDDRDGDISGMITVSGNVNSNSVGTYSLSYNVSDGAGNKASTVTRSVNVMADTSNQKPVVNFTQPSGNTVSANLGVVVSASDPDGSITRVELYLDGTLVRNEGGAPYEWGAANSSGNDTVLTNLSAGNHQLRAVAVDNDGATTSINRTVTVRVEASVLSHIGSNADYDGADRINISAPSNAKAGDLLLLFLSRTDDLLPIRLDGWTAGASCFKTNNGQRDCHEIRHCSVRDGDYCLDFDGGNGQDLATVVFYKTLGSNENRNYSFNLRGKHPSWAILSAVRGADNNNPIRNVVTESNDGNNDSLFPSVNGLAGDLLLLSMAFDDTTKQDDFRAPSGMEMHKWIAGNDEAGYVYGQKLTSTGQTGSKKTQGNGGSSAKDALISMTIRPSGSNDGGNTGGGDSGGSGGSDNATATNTLEEGQRLNANNYLESENGRYRLYLQGDGNIVLRDQQTGDALWSSKTNGEGGTTLVLQGDGNFVLYDDSDNAVWASGTNGTGASRAVINNDGSFAIYAGNDPVWAENGSGNAGGSTGGGDSGGNTGGGTSQTGTFETRISNSFDDVEEQSNGSVNATSSDLELIFDKSNQTVGMRFTGVSLPKGSTVTRAYVQFTTDETNSGSTSVRIKAHDVDDAPAFTTSSRNVSDRVTTNASISWQPAAWNSVGAATVTERTPDIKNMIQEVVSRSGWTSGNDIAIIMTGTGERTAESFDGSSSKAPLLHIEYTYTGESSGGGSDGNTGDGGTKIAFIGDTGAGGNFQRVLDLIKSEGAELTIVAGDTSYSSSRDDDWDAMVRNTLGSSDPALVVAGNHDYGDSNFGNVRSFGESRMNRQSAVQCSGDYAEKMTCNYKNVYFVMSAIGASGSQSSHESFISNSLNNAPDGAWRICAWHKNQKDMQVGGKSDETGWTAYETCRQQGAIISTGHEHSYSRTHLLSDMSSQTIASKSSTMTVEEGKTLAFVSGLGGIGIRDQERGGDHWAKIYTSTQGAKYGAMFGTFYDDRAEFYFKNINGQIIDQFTVIKGY